MKRWTWLAGVLVATLLAGCGSAGTPVDPAPVGSADRPMPADTDVSGKLEQGGSSAPSCNPRQSLRPNGSIPPESTMDAIKKRGYLIAGVDQATNLWGFRNPHTGELEGFDIDVVKAIAHDIFGTYDPNTIRFKAINSAERETVLAGGDVDVVVRTYSVTCERLQKVAFSSVYFEAAQRVLVTEKSGIENISQLGGKKVCAAGSSTSVNRLAEAKPKPKPVVTNNWTDCLVLLQQGQVSAVSTDDTILAGMAEEDPSTRVVGPPLSEELYGVGIPKGNEDMVRFVNATLEDFRQNEWRDRFRHWGLQRVLGNQNPPKPQYR
ncbi:polar amino acid transport system substrate-binding protein [Prauserella isguenensis]|uniref:Polar amino acid transport system substrate-binding protein n=1 Tax=Prauserella isguenensis TaxID=1470180 RepID=A0A839RXY1_9PSEU|nr:glutamate ABC transporter substrate-binding protein [Prauserella isguenensis]MBB3050012.1 polar amino acid transport system substrate-binding protein [Prauserella isguenensis]